jgi:hypothetical protein
MASITFERLYTDEEYITFSYEVESGDFAGASNFSISRTSLQNAISSLTEMYNSLKGSYQIRDYDSDDFVLFEFLSLGHMIISGQVGGSHRPQYLRYQFTTDQTVFGSIISSLRRMVL